MGWRCLGILPAVTLARQDARILQPGGAAEMFSSVSNPAIFLDLD